MHLSDKDREQILDGFIKVFTRISNKEYQKRIWINGEGPEVDDFDDTVCDFFGECDPILESYKDFGITDSQYDLLVKFRDEFRRFTRMRDLPQDFIDHPEWAKIVLMAKEVLEAFHYQKDLDQNTKNGTAQD